MIPTAQRVSRLRALRRSDHPADVRELAALYLDLIPQDPPLIVRARRSVLVASQVSAKKQSNDRTAA